MAKTSFLSLRKQKALIKKASRDDISLTENLRRLQVFRTDIPPKRSVGCPYILNEFTFRVVLKGKHHTNGFSCFIFIVVELCEAVYGHCRDVKAPCPSGSQECNLLCPLCSGKRCCCQSARGSKLSRVFMTNVVVYNSSVCETKIRSESQSEVRPVQ